MLVECILVFAIQISPMFQINVKSDSFDLRRASTIE